jgi:tetratricopeptide (TPR) repeat protein
MGRRTWVFPLAIAACVAFALEARADDWDACKNDNSDVSIFGCTAIIDAGTDPTESLAMAHYLRGNAYYRKTEFGRAIADYGKVITLDPDYANAYVLRGTAYEQQGRKQKAVADYRKALALRPGNKTATQGLQRLGVSSGKTETSTVKGSFKHFANTDFAGPLLKKTPADSAADCEVQCQANGNCAAFTFNVWNAACFLKSGVTTALLEPSSVSGLPAGAAAPPKSTAAKSMVRYRGRVFPGEPASAGASASFVTCEARCEDDPHCVAFSYVKESRICRQFARAGEYSKDKGIDSGIKRQVGQ